MSTQTGRAPFSFCEFGSLLLFTPLSRRRHPYDGANIRSLTDGRTAAVVRLAAAAARRWKDGHFFFLPGAAVADRATACRAAARSLLFPSQLSSPATPTMTPKLRAAKASDSGPSVVVRRQQ